MAIYCLRVYNGLGTDHQLSVTPKSYILQRDVFCNKELSIFFFCLFALSEILNKPTQTQLVHTVTKLQRVLK